MVVMFRRIFIGVLLTYLGSSYAADIPPPPYQLGNGQFIFIGVEWDEQTIQDFLPKELKPVDWIEVETLPKSNEKTAVKSTH